MTSASGGKRVLFYSGDDSAAKAEVRKLLDQAGVFPIDLGTLDVGAPRAALPFGPLAGISLIKV
jgi:8-hydroxy-5-deazaflavin:NADPH oxidoreductase